MGKLRQDRIEACIEKIQAENDGFARGIRAAKKILQAERPEDLEWQWDSSWALSEFVSALGVALNIYMGDVNVADRQIIDIAAEVGSRIREAYREHD